mgnify:CR=1 FL=1
MAFEIVRLSRGVLRLTADAQISGSEDFEALAEEAAQLGVICVRALKVGYVAARQADHEEEVITLVDGTETRNVARVGDWIVTNMDANQMVLRDGDGQVNSYVIRRDRFGELYEPTGARNEFGDVYRAKGVVEAVAFAGGFDIVAPWGERQRAEAGYIVRKGGDVYGVHWRAFEATYEVLG